MSTSHHRLRPVIGFSFAAALITACASSDPAPDDVSADQVEIVHGVADRGSDPAVVAIDVAGKGFCSGALIAPDVVLTARHCVAKTVEQITCPPDAKQVLGKHAAASLKILVGDDLTTATVAARGAEVVQPEGDTLCGADIALIVLDQPIDGIEPLDVRAAGVAKGDHVRAVGFGRASEGGEAGAKLVREHVQVLEASDLEFLVGEATCQGDSGGPALDEETGEIVGVVSRGGPSCDGSGVHNIYTRADVYADLIDRAINPPEPPVHVDAGAEDGGKHHRDAGKHRKDGGKHRKPKSDLGATCKKASDCSAGVCVSEHGKEYCSRPCDSRDHCPAHFRCTKSKQGHSVCIEK